MFARAYWLIQFDNQNYQVEIIMEEDIVVAVRLIIAFIVKSSFSKSILSNISLHATPATSKNLVSPNETFFTC
jgi:hypothetical protein